MKEKWLEIIGEPIATINHLDESSLLCCDHFDIDELKPYIQKNGSSRSSTIIELIGKTKLIPKLNIRQNEIDLPQIEKDTVLQQEVDEDIVLPQVNENSNSLQIDDFDMDTEKTMSTDEKDDKAKIIGKLKPSTTSNKNLAYHKFSDHTYSLETKQSDQPKSKKRKLLFKNKIELNTVNVNIDKNKELNTPSNECDQNKKNSVDEIIEEWLDDEIVLTDDDNAAFAGFEMDKSSLSSADAPPPPQPPPPKSPQMNLPEMKLPTIESVRSMAPIIENNSTNNTTMTQKIKPITEKISNNNKVEIPLPKKIKLEDEFELLNENISENQTELIQPSSSVTETTRIVKLEPDLDCKDVANQDQPKTERDQPIVILKPKIPQQSSAVRVSSKPIITSTNPTKSISKPKISIVSPSTLMKKPSPPPPSCPYPINLIAVNPNERITRNSVTSNQTTLVHQNLTSSPPPPPSQPMHQHTDAPLRKLSNVKKNTILTKVHLPQPIQKSNIVMSEPISLAPQANTFPSVSVSSSFPQYFDNYFQQTSPSIAAITPRVPMQNLTPSSVMTWGAINQNKDEEIQRLSKMVKELGDQNIKLAKELDRQIVLTNQSKSQIKELLKVNIILSNQINPDCQCLSNQNK